MATTSIALRKEYYDACGEGDLDRVKKCVERGVDINGLYHGCSPFGLACGRGYQQIVEYLIEKNVDVAHQNAYNFTALMGASDSGCTKIAELLLIQNSSTDFICYQDRAGKTALMQACDAAQNEYEDVVKLLLFYDPSEKHIMIKDKDGKTAVDYAKMGTIKELLSAPFKHQVQTKRAKPDCI